MAEAAPALPTSDGTDLRLAVFDPLAPALQGHTRLFLVPDGDLTRLPFEILPLDQGRRLIDAYRLSYLSTGRDLLRITVPSPVSPTPALVLADPDFDLSSAPTTTPTGPGGSEDSPFARLPGTRLEGERIATLLGVPPRFERAVLEAQLKATRAPRLLHIATHGFFLPVLLSVPAGAGTESGHAALWRLSGPHLDNPLWRSGLALAGANTWLRGGELPAEAEDGILHAEDVTGLDLLGTELVVLSACETGLGEVLVGEGVVGLRRAFVLAGARTLVMSLWKVPDQQTQELMEEFYRRLLAGTARADALREAQLTLKAKYPAPLHWGAFISQGDPSALSMGNTPVVPR
jgi:CHAT domain-containing protein